MTYLIDLHLPKRCFRRHTSDKHWVTHYFRQVIRQRQRAFLSGNFILYHKLRNKVIRPAKSIRSSWEQLTSLRNCDPSRWWKHTKALTGLGKASSNLHVMANSLCGGDLSTLAGKVNSFFKSVSRYLVPLDAGMVPLDCPVPMHYIVNSETVSELLSEIHVNKAIGDDNPSWILRDHAFTLAHSICTIFNASIRENYLPAIWGSAIVIPIAKVNPPRIISKDLRPISLTAVLSNN